MPDKEMIERCAKAICKSGKFETGQGTCSLICMDQLGSARRDCSHAAKLHSGLVLSIIKAMREPTEKMLEAAMAPYIYNNDEVMNKAFRDTIAGYHKAMIDAVINE